MNRNDKFIVDGEMTRGPWDAATKREASLGSYCNRTQDDEEIHVPLKRRGRQRQKETQVEP